MAPTTRQSKKALGNVLVIGGCGFLGSHIVNLLITSHTCKISVLDVSTSRNRRSDSDGVSYHNGDITKLPELVKLFSAIKPDVVIHTASPNLMGANKDSYYKVNVEGTKCVVEACQKTGVKALVYTSSASVVSDNESDLVNADERWPIIPPKSQTEYYSQTKVSPLLFQTTICPIPSLYLTTSFSSSQTQTNTSQAEAEASVLAANRSSTSPSLLTCALRPAGIFGEADVQVLPPIINVYHTSKTGFQLGSNENLFDFTYVENVAHAHILASDALLATRKMKTQPLDHEKVDGEAFFVTNDEPVPFWDFARMVWKACGSPHGTEHVWVISKEMGLLIGGVLEWGMWLVGRTPKLTRRQVKYSCMTRYYDISKAKKRLGYAPIVGLEEGIIRGVKYFEEGQKAESEKKAQ